jgi:hypothetical protein
MRIDPPADSLPHHHKGTTTSAKKGECSSRQEDDLRQMATQFQTHATAHGCAAATKATNYDGFLQHREEEDGLGQDDNEVCIGL